MTRLLNDHPNVVCNGEVFNPDDPDYNWDQLPPQNTAEMIKRAFQDYPLRGHDRYSVKAVGCKMEDLSLLQTEPQRLQQLMDYDPDMKFIVLQRRNQFECLRSMMQAWATDQWQAQDGQQTAMPKVMLPPPTARAFFERAEVFYGRISLLIPPARRIWVDYDQLRAHSDYVLSHLWTFLGVKDWTSHSELVKMEERSLRDTVENYEELQLLFDGTDYSCFLP